MGKKGSSAPKPDKNIGKAALRTAELGEDYLGFMKEQAAITNSWAATDRYRQQEVFVPLENDFIVEAYSYDTPERKAQAAAEATADVRQQSQLAREAERRQMTRMGVDPRSGRYAAVNRGATMREGLASAGAANNARRQVDATGRQLRGAAIDMGKGLAVNPATSMGMSNSATSAGFQGAMNGQSQAGDLLNTQYQQQMASWQAQQQASGDFWGAVGGLTGMALFSSKEFKEDKSAPRRSMLKATREMPVEEWKYKDGIADGGQHIGPYAEDFQKATGKGDGKTIDVIDAIGVNMGAVQELDQSVQKLAAKVDKMERRAMPKPRAGAREPAPAPARNDTPTRKSMPRRAA